MFKALVNHGFMPGLLLIGIPVRAASQTYACLPDTAQETRILYDDVLRLVTGTDSLTSVTRNAYKLPAVAASKVSVVTSGSVCNQAGTAYNAAVSPGVQPVSRTLVVIKIGTTRYVVLDPDERAGEFQVQVVFDKQWSELIRFMS